MSSDFDAGLRERMRGLRDDDIATAPSFEQLLKRHPRIAPRAFRGTVWAVIATATIIVIGFGLMRQRPAPELQTLTWTAWQSPTGSLLNGFGEGFSSANWKSPTTALAPSPSAHRKDSP